MDTQESRSAVRRRLSRLVQDLTGRSASRLVERLTAQLDCTARGAQLTESLINGRSPAQAHDIMRQLEHEGDETRALLITELSTVLATPVDAEDLFRLSRSIDDILDNLRDFVREVDLYQPADLGFALPLVHELSEGLATLRPALTQLTERDAGGRQAATDARKYAGRARWLYQHQLAALFDEPLSTETLKRRELLRRLDVVGLRLGEATDALADGMLKRGR